MFSNRLMPFIAGVIAVVVSLVLWQALSSMEQAHLEKRVQMKAEALADDIGSRMEARVLALVRMARRWESRGMPTRDEWESDAELYAAHYAGYQAIAWVDPSLHVRWLVPRKGNEEAVDRYLGFEPTRLSVFESARTRREAVLSGPIDLVTGGKGFLAVVPILGVEDTEGFIVGAFKGEDLLEDILPAETRAGGYLITVLNGDTVLYSTGSGAMPQKAWAEKGVDLYGRRWSLRVRPSDELLADERSSLPEIILLMGIITGLAFAATIHFARSAREREAEVKETNLELRNENDKRRRAEEASERHARELETANVELEREVVVRKRAEEAAERNASELKRSNEELEQFAYVASHDLQEPLRIVAGYVQLLERRYKGKLDADADEFIDYAVDGAKRMQVLIRDLLTYSRVGRHETYSRVDCGKVLDHTLESLKASVDESGAVVTRGLLPEITADAAQVEHLFLNLLSNAIKYRGEEPPRVHVSAEREPRGWRFSVSDNGIGIDPKHGERIFVIFQRLHGKGEYHGTGMGLAICRKVVENHGGRIWVEPRNGGGSVFHFTIPDREVDQ